MRLRATSPTYGPVTVAIVDEPDQDRFYLLCLETERSAPQLIRRWRRRSWIEFVFRTLKHLLAAEACQARSADAYYGHLVLRLMGSFVLFYTARVICKGRLSMEEMIFISNTNGALWTAKRLNSKHFHRGDGKQHKYKLNSDIGKVSC